MTALGSHPLGEYPGTRDATKRSARSSPISIMMMMLVTALLLSRRPPVFAARRASKIGPQRHVGAPSRALAFDREHLGLLAWTVGYALVALISGAVGVAGIASGLSLSPFVHLLAFSALALAASLLLGIAVMLAGLASLPRRPREGLIRRFG